MDGGFWMGLFQGVLVTVVISVIGFLGRGMLGRLLALFPWLEPTSVRGTWDTKWWKNRTDNVELEENTEVVELKQFLHYVWGTVEYTPFDGITRIYRLHGIIRQGVFVATYELKDDPSALDLGSFTVMIADGLGKTMEGKYSWPDDVQKKPISGDYKWKRRAVPGKKQEVG